MRAWESSGGRVDMAEMGGVEVELMIFVKKSCSRLRNTTKAGDRPGSQGCRRKALDRSPGC
ncbi:MAG: hypothetical protein HLUCCO16_17195 [Phormidium sp. OSCR]|nr:MAG: hypothetical protein HLUCCO16_17195 [Phormidium sp. OSCR]